MHVLVLMAGDGSRFANTEFTPYKPFIEVNGRTILDWTLDSFPNIRAHDISFAIRSDHDRQYDVSGYLSRRYRYCGICSFPHLTRGNLETALLAALRLEISSDHELLILDSDNHFNGMTLLPTLRSHPCSICAFNPIDDNTKWCFSLTDENGHVKKLLEKDPQALLLGGKPMIGVFYFKHAAHFYAAAASSLAHNHKTGNGEFYMSQAVQHLISIGYPVHCETVDGVVPLGTPDDVRKFAGQ